MVSSENGGQDLNHQQAIRQVAPASIITYPNAKKSGLLRCNPANDDHLAYLFLSNQYEDLDVFIAESFDAGATWTEQRRVNDDPIGNNRMQDMVWADFNSEGDLVVSWRDRRNGSDSTYQTASEIWAAFKENGSQTFSPNFSITSEVVDFDSILENAGNDFMCIKLHRDTLYATWGDARDGILNIWFQQMTTDGLVLSTNQISSEEKSLVNLYPNPSNHSLFLESKAIQSFAIFELSGKRVLTQTLDLPADKLNVNIEALPKGTYLIEIQTHFGTIAKKIVKQ